MKQTCTKFSLVLSFILVLSFGLKAQTLTSITPNASLPGQTLTTTITGQGNVFLPGSPFGGSDLRMEQHSGSFIIYSDPFVNYIDANDISATWEIPSNAPADSYDLQADVDDGTGTGNAITLTLDSAFQVYPVVTLSQAHTNTTCGNSNGTISLTVNTGTPPYSFQWNNGSTDEDISNLPQGSYDVTVTDANNSIASLTNINVGNTNGPTVSLGSAHKAICTSLNGSVSVNVSGGTTPYNYAWSNGTTTLNISNVAAGSYTLTVTDKNLCDNFLNATVADTNDLNVTYSIVKPKCGYNSGSIVALGHGQAPLTYLWNNGTANSVATNLSSGLYEVTVTDNYGCIQSQVINASESFNFYVYTSSTAINCSAKGTVTTQVYGGTPPYTYAWSNSDTTANITDITTPGDYYVTITDSSGCQRFGAASITSGCYNFILGTVFNDANNNCIFDAGDSPLQGYTIYAVGTNGYYYYGYTDANGHYSIGVPGGNSTYQVEVPAYSSNACASQQLASCGNSSVTFTGVGGDTATVNFTTYIPTGSFDLAMHPGWRPAKPGFVKPYWVYYYNLTTSNYTGPVTIIFQYDSNLTFIDSVAPHPVNDAVARTLTWTVNGAPALNNGWTYLPFFMRIKASTPLNYLLQNTYTILPTVGDCDSANNVMYVPDVVGGSRDPNEKDVSPSGIIGDADSVLTYTIHFQNNGTDTTSFVIVTDTLPAGVNPATVVNIASNPQYSQFSISGRGVLKWVFNPAYLVDSATNADASKGFITFSIKRRDSLPTGTQIGNKAFIYFDYNNAVITNTVTDTVLSSIATVTTNVTGNGVSVNAYPNPFAQSTTFEVNGISGKFNFTLTNVLGQTMTELDGLNSNQFTLNRNNLTPGIYFYSIKSGNKEVANGKLVVVDN